MDVTDFLRDNDKRPSSSRLGYLVGVCIASILVVFLALTSALTDGMFMAYCVLVSGGYTIGKLSDSFGSEVLLDVADSDKC